MALSNNQKQEILNYLPKWRIQNPPSSSSSSSNTVTELDAYLDSTEIADLDYNYEITESEMELTYNQTKKKVQLRIGNIELTEEEWATVDSAILEWTAGVLYKKHNIRANMNVDESFPQGYGDGLIKEAQQLLKPFAYTLTYL